MDDLESDHLLLLSMSNALQAVLLSAGEIRLPRIVFVSPNGHLKLLHLWPPKLPQARRVDYASELGAKAMRAATSRSL
jgi:hypothetical protein